MIRKGGTNSGGNIRDTLEGNFREQGPPSCIQSRIEYLHHRSVHNLTWDIPVHIFGYFIQMVPLQPRNKKWKIFSKRHFKVFNVQLKGPLPLSTQAQRYTWQTSSSRHQKPKLPSTPIREPDLMGSFPKPLKSPVST